MRKPLRIALVLALLLLAAGGFWLHRSRTASQAGDAAGAGFTQLVAVQRGDLSASIDVVGELDAVQRADLAFEHVQGSTPLLTLEVETGNTVAAGQVLATIDPAPYRQAVDQATSDLQAAEATLADLEAPPTGLEIAQSDLAVSDAAQRLAQARRDLAEVGSPDLGDCEATLLDAEDDLAIARLQLTLAEHDSLAKTERDLQYAVGWHERRIAELEVLLSSGKANAEQAAELTAEREALLESQANLAGTQAERQLSLLAAGADVAQAELAVAEAQQALAEARTGGDKLARAQAELAVKEAEVALASAEDGRAQLAESPVRGDEGADAVTLAAARADADKKRLALAEAEQALAGCTMTAPFDGVVLQVRAAPGDSVDAATTILTVANLKNLQVLASVDETTIRKVEAGQRAQITFDALPDLTLSGEVGSAPLQGTLQGGVTVYEVPISLAGAESLPLLMGMTANVQIQAGEVEDGLLVPSMALVKSNGLVQVLVADRANPEAEPHAAPVEVGLDDGAYAEIVRGLNEGDLVVVEMDTAESSTLSLRGIGGIGGMGGGMGPGGVPPAGR